MQPEVQPALQGRRILLIIGGGIAAYKTLEVIRRLTAAGASVVPVLTRAGEEFVTPLSVAALAGEEERGRAELELAMPGTAKPCAGPAGVPELPGAG
ncbi:flavoprotein, partial [Streptomyces sp. P9(2023)]|uniref:flavoprotein n=1 Tax=Streptomyces sp. P9(2023) TaxID=3064394 RepID=UPI0028F440C3